MFASGRKTKCSDGVDLIDGKVYGVIHLSFGACSTLEELVTFVDLLKELYLDNKEAPNLSFEMCELTELLVSRS